MRVWPAIDLMGGRAVQLEGGDPEKVLVEEADPLDLVDRFAKAGADGVHVVDLDRAMEQGDNLETLLELIGRDLEVQAAGGLRDRDAVETLPDAGAARVVVGTRALADPGWLADLAADHPDRVVVALDVAGGEVVTRGWSESTGLALPEAVDRVACDGLAAILCTHVDREGRVGGVDPGPFRVLVHHAPVPVIAAGGVASLRDVDRLADAGVAEIVVGSAIYLGDLDLTKVIDHARP